MSTENVFMNFIGGQWVESVGHKTFNNINPADSDDCVGTFQRSNSEDIAAAVAAARTAFPAWKRTPAPKRAEILFRAGQLLAERKEALAREMTREMGKPLEETRGDVQEAIDMTFYMAGEGRRLVGQTTTSELPSKFCMSVRSAIGVCGLITPWNFPMAIPAWKIMPALICGNTVVIKPAEDTPLSAFNLAKVLEEVGLPPGVVNCVSGFGPEAGAPLAAHPDVPVISFTGSSEAGRKVAHAGADHSKHVCLEMGGKNVIIVLEDANLDLAIDGAIWGGFGTTGQRCTASSRVVIHNDIYSEFEQRFLQRTTGIEGGQRH